MNERFSIPTANLPKLFADMEKLSEKNKAAGGSGVSVFPLSEDAQYTTVALMAGAIAVDNYHFIARIDHSYDSGNILHMLPTATSEVTEAELNPYRDRDPVCDHCNINRRRADTYILRNQTTGDLSQVGSSCMKKMFAIDPAKICRQAEILINARGSALAATSVDTYDFIPMRNRLYISTHLYLVACARAIRTCGFVSAKMSENTGEITTRVRADSYYMSGFETQEDVEMAKAAQAWAAAIEDADNSYMHNISVLARGMYFNGRQSGFVASIIAAYLRQLPKEPDANVGDMSGVIQLLKKGGARLQNPKITLQVPHFGTVVMTLAKDHHKVPGSVNVASEGGYGNNTFYGRIMPDGKFVQSRFSKDSLVKGLQDLGSDPANVAAAHGAVSGNCCFCRKKLTHDDSTAVGYGRTCAENYGLPYRVRELA